MMTFLIMLSIDLDKYGIVTSNRTDEAFATKKDEPLLPFGTAEQR